MLCLFFAPPRVNNFAAAPPRHINHLYPENGGGWGYGVIYKNAKIVGWAEDNTVS